MESRKLFKDKAIENDHGGLMNRKFSNVRLVLVDHLLVNFLSSKIYALLVLTSKRSEDA